MATRAAIIGAWVPDAASYTLDAATVNVTPNTPYYPTGDGAADDLITVLGAALGLSLGLNGSTLTGAGSVTWTGTFPSWIFGASGTDPSPLIWLPERALGRDTRDRQVHLRGRAMSISGIQAVTDFGESASSREFEFSHVRARYVLNEFAEATDATFEDLNRYCLSVGAPFRLYPDATTVSAGTGFGTYVRTDDTDPDFTSPKRLRVRVEARGYVA